MIEVVDLCQEDVIRVFIGRPTCSLLLSIQDVTVLKTEASGFAAVLAEELSKIIVIPGI